MNNPGMQRILLIFSEFFKKKKFYRVFPPPKSGTNRCLLKAA